jgi:chromosome partitioning protein
MSREHRQLIIGERATLDPFIALPDDGVSPSPRRRAMIVALLNQKGGLGKTTLALHVTGALAAQGKRVVVIDADPQGSALDWSEQRAKEGLPRLFGIIGLARDTLYVEAPEIARDFNHVLIDGSSRIAALMRSAMLAADLALVPAQTVAVRRLGVRRDVAAASGGAHLRPRLAARFVLNRCGARTVIARESADALANQEPPVLAARVGQRVGFADAARTGRLVSEVPRSEPAAREIAALATEIERVAR